MNRKTEKFEIRYGLGGGFGGVENMEWEEIEAFNLDEAIRWAYEEACQVYESYEGTNGLRTVEEIMEEDDCSEKEAEIAWDDERESWLDYEARPLKETP